MSIALSMIFLLPVVLLLVAPAKAVSQAASERIARVQEMPAAQRFLLGALARL
jgi:hypothetical protein